MELIVHACRDFEITGRGENAQWAATNWEALQKLDGGGKPYKSQFKMMYSPRGVYVLFYGEDDRISSSLEHDFEKIYMGDVFEVFFRSDPGQPCYFEYEISPLGKELVLLMTIRNDVLMGWAPWPYEKEDRVKKKVCVRGGPASPGACISYWTAELFIPYRLLAQLNHVPPAKGTRWYGNFCRLDYDSGNAIKWAWAPVETSFHETDNYLPLVFE
ncbi:carbohydrate-binding family 9-like protein [Parapedobacter soli]|uniref:carbohydrate-binding family 9-like protein n=1 Tax=Parapedobacter soli TaxID=416955 RepID=UPI0021C59C0E|nr:carbohydrate-binding family 9-like protein [Parapedobacter soli]